MVEVVFPIKSFILFRGVFFFSNVPAMFQAISLSKRFSPELLNFLVGIIFMSVPKDSQTVIPYVPPFKVVGKESTFLFDALKKRQDIFPNPSINIPNDSQ